MTDDFYRRPRRKPRQLEQTDQMYLFNWIDANIDRFPLLQKAYAIPNGGYRPAHIGAQLKASGVMAGVFDIHLPVARGKYHGLYAEMKMGKGRLSDEQKAFKTMVEDEGYYTIVCYGHEAVAAGLIRYLAFGEFRWVPLR